ncbi:MAG: carbon starvation protein A [Thermoflexales bacterium]|nr:carbon starvation protein A [Thermoflexales bacterium]
MNALVVLLLAAIGLGVGYGVYAKTIDRKVIQPDPNKATPAKMYMDGVDFIPANRNVLFGYQFKSIAALGPILGPIIALQWGWLPALAWIILGTFFIGWVQDYSSIIVGVREEGQTFGALSYRLVSPRARNILLAFIYVYLLMIMGAFGIQVGFTLLTRPAVPLGVIIVTLAGLLAGQMTYKWKQDIILTTVVTVIIALAGIWVGTLAPVKNFFTALYGLDAEGKSPILFLQVTRAGFIGSLLVLIFCYLGAVLPIWRWAQPINYVAFWIVLFGVLGGILGLLIGRPSLGDFPAFTAFFDPKTTPGGPLWPMLFVTIACGAISGWHSLVSSSGTARQLEKETDALYVGGGAMFLEMVFATIAFLTATAGVGFAKYTELKGWTVPAAIFPQGLSAFLNYWGLDAALGQGFGVAYGSVFLTLMALTIMHLVVRFMRVASAEALGDRFPILRNVHVGTIIALLFTIFLIWFAPFLRIWGIFGAANQLMAALALLLVTLWLMSKAKNYQWTFWPFAFMFVTTVAALLWQTYDSFFVKLPAQKTWDGQVAFITMGVLALILVVLAIILVVDGIGSIRRYRAELAKARR